MFQSGVEKICTENDLAEAELDKEILSLQQQVSRLRARRSIQASTILSFPSTLSTLNSLREHEQLLASPEDFDSLVSALKTQISHNQTNLYRLCATVTSFLIQDLDPNALNKGRVLALRFDVSSRGSFTRPYYVMFNKPWEGESRTILNVHRHTLPPAIPIMSLVKKYLPNNENTSLVGAPATRRPLRQSLLRFSRALRRFIVAYHNRLSTINGLRNYCMLNDHKIRDKIDTGKFLLDISPIDAEMKQIHLEWVDKRIGRLVTDEDGKIKKCVVLDDGVRDRVAERILQSDMSTLGEKLEEDYQRKARISLSISSISSSSSSIIVDSD
ncbi:putative cenp-o kinetochore centromere component [Golovinomyces cichoracearum]|uniref:Putative cenp-o kinetochore centromere component n=1 Tax=Golovinomyces cichoracearum TaxID=62708 RepID=A0A420IEF1_9PEZI|nr:putative cenp-o kinetochore centromere component [Golovinomyces cichoracearum]